MAARAPSSRRPVSARSLRCGLRSSFLVTAPSLRSVATTRLHATSLPSTIRKRFLWAMWVGFIDVDPRFLASCRVPPGGIVPPGLVIRRPSGSPCLRRVRSTQTGGFLPKIATTSCRRCRVAPVRSRVRGHCEWRHPAESCDGILPSLQSSSRVLICTLVDSLSQMLQLIV